MIKFMNHDVIGLGLFNRDLCSCSHAMTAWQAELVNNQQTLLLFCDRLSADFSNLGLKFRKPWSYTQADSRRNLRT